MTKIDAAALCSDWLDLDTEVTSTFAKSDRDSLVKSSAADSLGEAMDGVAPPAQMNAAANRIRCGVQVLLGAGSGIPRYVLIYEAPSTGSVCGLSKSHASMAPWPHDGAHRHRL